MNDDFLTAIVLVGKIWRRAALKRIFMARFVVTNL